MHNSLFVREILKRANRNPAFTRFRDPYRGLSVGGAAAGGAGEAGGEVSLAGAWRLVLDPAIDEGAATALRSDLRKLWQRLGGTIDGPETAATLELRLEGGQGARDARLVVEPGRVTLAGGGVAGLWAGLAWMVWELRVGRAGRLKRGRREFAAAWPIQISQGPLGGNYSVPDLGPDYLSDESLRLYAHSGVNSMMIYGDLLCYSRSSILPQLDHARAEHHLAQLREAGERAARYGVGFTYVPVHPKLPPGHAVFEAHPRARGRGFRMGTHHFHILCSTEPTVLGYYAEQYERLFAAVPQLQGVLAITYSESFYHCDMWRAHESEACPRCAALGSDERLLPLLEAVAQAIRRGNPRAFLAEWIYSWPLPDNGGRGLAAIHATRDAGVGVCQSVDKDPLYDGKTVYQKPGYRKAIWDYCLEYEGPTAYAREAAEFAHGQGRVFVAKTETGIGIETMQLPYVPAFPHLARKWEGVRSLRPTAVHQAWLFYGHHHSRAERLAAWAAYRSDLPANAFLEELATADFGPAAAPGVLACWSRFARAIKHLPCLHLGNYYQSPSFFGPLHPLLPDAGAPVPDLFHASLFYLQENGPSFTPNPIESCRVPMVLIDLPATPAGVGVALDPGLGWETVADEYAIAAQEGRKGWEALAGAGDRLETAQDRLNWEEEMALAELTWRTFLACRHVVEFMHARRARAQATASAAEASSPAAAAKALAIMRRVALDEAANARAAGGVYERAPWLDPSLRIDGIYPTAAACIAEKCRIIDAFMASTAT